MEPKNAAPSPERTEAHVYAEIVDLEAEMVAKQNEKDAAYAAARDELVRLRARHAGLVAELRAKRADAKRADGGRGVA